METETEPPPPPPPGISVPVSLADTAPALVSCLCLHDPVPLPAEEDEINVPIALSAFRDKLPAPSVKTCCLQELALCRQKIRKGGGRGRERRGGGGLLDQDLSAWRKMPQYKSVKRERSLIHFLHCWQLAESRKARNICLIYDIRKGFRLCAGGINPI